MSKTQSHPDQHAHKTAAQQEAPKAAPAKTDGKTGETKPEAKKGEPKHAAESSKAKSKGHEPVAGHCCGWGCKALATRFNFCSEHFDHFKFGLLKKTGEPVPDYEKKFEHFMAFQARQRVQKAA
ncbi:MAG: hypothetical protein HYX41_00790 [Bdellovibrio sp.]|nr:hypothetical protein [Bdellovibrio sp.]